MAELKKASVGSFLTPQDRAYNAELAKTQHKQALEWLSIRFSDVRPEQITERTASDIDTILHWQDWCAVCKDPAKCRHSRAMLEICDEPDPITGLRFVTRARMCDMTAKAQETAQHDYAFQLSGIPEARQGDTFDAFDIFSAAPSAKIAKGMARDCVELGRGLVIGGPVGCGKTHLAIAMGLEALAHNRSVRFWLMPDLMQHLRPGSQNAAEDYEQCKKCDLLIIDDAGTEQTTNWTDEKFFMLVDARYNAKKPIVITTNAAGNDGLRALLKGERGERIFSRLLQMTEQAWMTDAQDWRKKHGKRV